MEIMLGNPERFDNVRAAGRALSTRCNIDPYNAVDCIYKALRSTKKTHGYVVERDDKKGVVLRAIKNIKIKPEKK